MVLLCSDTWYVRIIAERSATSREIKAVSLWGVKRRRVRQTGAVVGNQRQDTRCFRELKVASQQHKKLAKITKYYLVYFVSRARAYSSTTAVSPMKKRFSLRDTNLVSRQTV